jgi:abhydrolase domain-containing protein 6
MKRVFIVAAATLAAMMLSVCLWMAFAPPEQVAATLLDLERGRSGFELRELSIPGFRIAYMEAGKGEPLVLLHGFTADKDHWTRVAPYLVPRFHVIAIDLPGFGESDKPMDRHYTGGDQVGYLREIVGALGLTSFHLGGNSMGGMISARFAAAYPGEVKSLWLLAPGGVGAFSRGDLAGLKPGDHVPLLARSLADTDKILRWVTSNPPYVPGAVKRMIAERAAADYSLHAQIFFEINDEWARAPLEKTVAGLETPTRIVWGEEDRLLPIAGAEPLHAAMPNSSLLSLPGIGHLPMIEAPQVVAEDYLAFVEPTAH